MQVGLAVGIQFVTAFPERAYKAMLIPSLVEAGRLGKDRLLSFHIVCRKDAVFNHVCAFPGEKSGKGFYLYDSKRRARPDPAIKELVESSRKFADLIQDGKVLTRGPVLSQS